MMLRKSRITEISHLMPCCVTQRIGSNDLNVGHLRPQLLVKGLNPFKSCFRVTDLLALLKGQDLLASGTGLQHAWLAQGVFLLHPKFEGYCHHLQSS